jgi:hypothetical protein
MRKLPLLLLALLLAGCAGTRLYTPQDMVQVHQADATIVPIYKSFKRAYVQNYTAGILEAFHREQVACRLVDVIDQRDSIDPNIQLFQASASLDNLCNDIEGIYVGWAKKHHYRYDKSIPPAFVADTFKGADLEVKKLPGYLKHPTDLLA